MCRTALPFLLLPPLPPKKRNQSKLIKIIFIENTSSQKTYIPPCASNFFFLPSAIARNRSASRHFHEKQERFRIRRSCYAPTRRPIRLCGHADSACRVDPTRFHDRTNGETDAEPSPDDFGRKGGRPRRQEQDPRTEDRLGTGDGARHIVFEGTTAASARRRTSRRQPFGNRATCTRSYRMATLPPETNRRRAAAAPDGFKVPSPSGTPSRAERRERHAARRLGLSLPNTIHSSGTPRPCGKP